MEDGLLKQVPGELEADILHCSIDVHRFRAICVRQTHPVTNARRARPSAVVGVICASAPRC